MIYQPCEIRCEKENESGFLLVLFDIWCQGSSAQCLPLWGERHDVAKVLSLVASEFTTPPVVIKNLTAALSLFDEGNWSCALYDPVDRRKFHHSSVCCREGDRKSLPETRDVRKISVADRRWKKLRSAFLLPCAKMFFQYLPNFCWKEALVSPKEKRDSTTNRGQMHLYKATLSLISRSHFLQNTMPSHHLRFLLPLIAICHWTKLQPTKLLLSNNRHRKRSMSMMQLLNRPTAERLKREPRPISFLLRARKESARPRPCCAPKVANLMRWLRAFGLEQSLRLWGW